MEIENLPQIFKKFDKKNEYGNYKNIITQKINFCIKLKKNDINLDNLKFINNELNSKYLLKYNNIYEINEENFCLVFNNKLKVVDENNFKFNELNALIILDRLLNFADFLSNKSLIVDPNNFFIILKNNSYKFIFLNYFIEKDYEIDNKIIFIKKLFSLFQIKINLDKEIKCSKNTKKKRSSKNCSFLENMKLDKDSKELKKYSLIWYDIAIKFWHFKNCLICNDKKSKLITSFMLLKNNIKNRIDAFTSNIINIEDGKILNKPSLKYIKKIDFGLNFEVSKSIKFLRTLKKLELVLINGKSKEFLDHNLNKLYKVLSKIKNFKKLSLDFEKNYLTNKTLEQIYKYFKTNNIKHFVLKINDNFINNLNYFFKLINKNNNIKFFELDIGNKENKIKIKNNIILNNNIESFNLKISYAKIYKKFSIMFNNKVSSIELSFFKCNLNNQMVNNILRNFKNLNYLEDLVLDFSRNCLTDNGINNIANVISGLKKLKNLRLLIYGNEIKENCLIKLINCITKLKYLDKLVINYMDYLNPHQFENKSYIKNIFNSLKIKNKTLF